jgi:hypothetical protein
LSSRWWAGASGAIGLVVGALLVWLLPMPPTPAALTAFLADLIKSPGIGGLAAVVAASIAYTAARKSARSNQQSAAVSQWWENARWATDKLLSSTETTRPDEGLPAGWDALVDPDARAAITALDHLLENAPTPELSDFVLDVMAAVLDDSDPDADASPLGMDGAPE